MADTSKAHLSEALWEQIASDQYGVNLKFWPQITAMKESSITKVMGAGLFGPALPPRPKLRIKLFELLGSYAIELFTCEYRHYPDENKTEWAEELVTKTVANVAKNIELIEANFAGLEHHAPYTGMLAAARTALTENLKVLPKPLVMLPLPAPPEHLPIPIQNAGPLVADQLKLLFDESGISVKVAAKALDIKPKSVYRHIHGDATPREGHIEGYEKLFSGHLGKTVKIESHKKVKLKSPKSHSA
jgi:hypothetical protein